MRKVLVAVLAVALVLGGALLASVRPRPCPVNPAACERIELDMTEAEVQAALGGPAGDYRTRDEGSVIVFFQATPAGTRAVALVAFQKATPATLTCSN